MTETIEGIMWTEEEYAEHKKWKANIKNSQHLEKITAILYKHDPMDLAKMGVPEDEYDIEARTICDSLAEEADVYELARLVYHSFDYWFGGMADDINPIDYVTMAVDIQENIK